MTSEQKNERRRVENRLERARALLQAADLEWSAHYEKFDHKTYEHKWLIIHRRVKRIESTLRGYD